MSFDPFDLLPTTRRALASMSISTPTAIQALAIPPLLDGIDVIAKAHTGSGKTLAFGIPMLECIDPAIKQTQGIVLAPTRELAQQVGTVLKALSKGAGIEVAIIYGGVGYEPQITALKNGAHIVVGTPGRVLDHLERRTLRLDGINFLVLDEADEMLDRGFARDVEKILRMTPEDRQTALFSATTPDWVASMAKKHLHDPLTLTVGDLEEAPPDIEHAVVEVWSGDKFPVLISLLQQDAEGATIVFGRTRRGVENLAKRLGRLGFEVAALQGNLGQGARDTVMNRFRSGRVPILLATNVAARGLDMLNIDRVINYDLPETGELFTHRVGRTGRIGRSGLAVTLITTVDLPKMQEIERHLGRKLPRVNVPAATSMPAPAPVSARSTEVIAKPAAAAPDAEGEAPRRRRRRRRPTEEGAPVPAASASS